MEISLRPVESRDTEECGRVVRTMTLMAMGEYVEPRGSFITSAGY